MNKPRIKFWSTHWEVLIPFSIQFSLGLFGVNLFSIELLLFRNPLGYSITLGILNFGILISDEDDWL